LHGGSLKITLGVQINFNKFVDLCMRIPSTRRDSGYLIMKSRTNNPIRRTLVAIGPEIASRLK